MLLRRVVVLAVAMGVCAAAHAQDDAAKRAKVEEYFRLTHTDQMAAQVLKMVAGQVEASMREQLSGMALSPEQQQIVDETLRRVYAIVDGSVGWKAMEPEYEKLFARAYTDKELDDLNAFYRSPSGQALVAKTPQLLTEASALAEQHVSAAMPAVQQVIREGLDRATAATPKPRGAQ